MFPAIRIHMEATALFFLKFSVMFLNIELLNLVQSNLIQNNWCITVFVETLVVISGQHNSSCYGCLKLRGREYPDTPQDEVHY